MLLFWTPLSQHGHGPGGAPAAGAVIGESGSPLAAIFDADPSISGRNFDVIGDNPWLFYPCADGTKKLPHISNANVRRAPLKVGAGRLGMGL